VLEISAQELSVNDDYEYVGLRITIGVAAVELSVVVLAVNVKGVPVDTSLIEEIVA